MIERKLKELQMKFQMLWLRRRLLLAITAIGALVGLCVALFLVTPQYTADNELYFSAYTARKDKSIRDSQLENSRGLAESYSVYMKEPFMFARAEENQPRTLSHHYTAGELGRAIDIRVDSDANVIFFKVTTNDPRDSAIICDFYSEFSMQQIVNLTGVGTYEIFNETKIPTVPSFPDPILYTLVGALMGLIAAVAFALKVKQKIYGEREIKILLPGCKILSSIPEFK